MQRAFQYSNTLIITPSKTYDPANEFDEEYFEFGLFMSRREYKTIKRRMQNGRYAAISEGKWPYNSAPYGFRRVKLEKEKGWTLAFDENEAPVVRLIFSMFTGPERVGIRSITRTLNSYGTKPRNSKLWVRAPSVESSLMLCMINALRSANEKWSGQLKTVFSQPRVREPVTIPLFPAGIRA